MKQDKTPSPHTPRRRFDPGRGVFMAYLGVCTSTLLCQPAFAADTIWTKASEVMKDVYTQILAISTIAAIVTAAVGRIPGLAEAHRHHLDHPELPGIHHELRYALLLRRTVDSAVTTYGHFRRHCSMDRGTSHARPGLNKHISFGRSGLRYGCVSALLPGGRDDV